MSGKCRTFGVEGALENCMCKEPPRNKKKKIKGRNNKRIKHKKVKKVTRNFIWIEKHFKINDENKNIKVHK